MILRQAFARAARGGFPLVVAHRGLWRGVGPENALSSVRAASAVDMVEIDLRLSRDGTPVLIHDPTVTRTTGQDGRVSTLSDAKLKAMRLRDGLGGPDAPMTAETVPTLAEALSTAGHGLLFDLDVKDESQLSEIAERLQYHPARDRVMLKMSVTQLADLTALLDMQDGFGVTVIAKVRLHGPDDIDLIRSASTLGVTAAEVWFADLDLLRGAVATGLPISTYTLNDVHCAGLSDQRALGSPASVWGVLRDCGISAIMTDEPAAAAAYLHGLPVLQPRAGDLEDHPLEGQHQ